MKQDFANLQEKTLNQATNSTAGSSGQQLHSSNNKIKSCLVVYAAKDPTVQHQDQLGSGLAEDETQQCGSLFAPPPLHYVCVTPNYSLLCACA